MRLRWMLTGLLALAMVMAISPALAQDAAEEETAVDPDVQAVTDALTAVIDSVRMMPCKIFQCFAFKF